MKEVGPEVNGRRADEGMAINQVSDFGRKV